MYLKIRLLNFNLEKHTDAIIIIKYLYFKALFKLYNNNVDMLLKKVLPYFIRPHALLNMK